MFHPIIHKANLFYNSITRYEAPEDVFFELVGKAQDIHKIASLVLAWAKYRHIEFGLPMTLPFELELCKKSNSAWKIIEALPDALKVTRNSGTWSGGSEGLVKAQGKGLDQVRGKDKLSTNYDIVPPSDKARREASRERLPYVGTRMVRKREKCHVFDNKRGLHIPTSWY